MKSKIKDNIHFIFIIIIALLVFMSIVSIRINMNFKPIKFLPIVLLIIAVFLYKKLDESLYKNVKYDEQELKTKGIKYEFLLKEGVIEKINNLNFIKFSIEFNSKKYFLVTKEHYTNDEIESLLISNAKVLAYVNHMNFKNYIIKIYQ